MLRNQNNIERISRIAVGLAVLFCFFVGPKSVWGLLGAIPLMMTGLLGWCPLYAVLGVSTCDVGRSENSA